VPIEANDLVIEHGRPGLALEWKCEIENWKGFELIFIPRNEPALASIDIGKRAESVVLQLEDPLRIIEG
jgi:hypothetical protein